MLIDANDIAFTSIKLISSYIITIAGIVTLAALVVGGVDTGWTFYTPLSSIYSNSHVALAASGVFVVGFSTIMTALNFVVTTHKLRAPGMTWFRLPMFVWTIYATSLVMLLATPVLAGTLRLIILDRVMGIGVFDPAHGGDPILFQHLFWFYSHPAVYIMVLPAMGVVSELLPAFAKRPLFGYKAVAASTMAIAAFSFLVWGHHMFVSGQSTFAGVVFSFLSFCIAVPSAIKIFNSTMTLRKGFISFEAPRIYALGFVFLFGLGGLTGLMVAATAVDVHVHDTYFVVAHFHYIMVGGSVSAFMGAVHYWWPKMTGRLYSERPAQVAAIATFLGFILTFLPQFVLGYAGMPRRYHEYPVEFVTWHALSSAGRWCWRSVTCCRSGICRHPFSEAPAQGQTPGVRPALNGGPVHPRPSTISSSRPFGTRNPMTTPCRNLQNERRRRQQGVRCAKARTRGADAGDLGVPCLRDADLRSLDARLSDPPLAAPGNLCRGRVPHVAAPRHGKYGGAADLEPDRGAGRHPGGARGQCGKGLACPHRDSRRGFSRVEDP